MKYKIIFFYYYTVIIVVSEENWIKNQRPISTKPSNLVRTSTLKTKTARSRIGT